MRIFHFFTRSIHTKLLLVVALTTTIILSVFISVIAIQERNDLINTNKQFGLKLATSLANSASLFLASHDIIRLQEICDAQKRYEDLDYAIFTDEAGEVLAHTDTSKVGLYLVDIPAKTFPQFFSVRDHDFTDILYPVYINNTHVGWIRLGINHKTAILKLNTIVTKGIVYLLAALFISVLIGYLSARQITRRLTQIENNIKRVKSGNTDARIHITGNDETFRLAASFNEMLDVLQEKEKELTKSQHKFEELFNAAPIAMAFLQQSPPMNMANKAFTELSATRRRITLTWSLGGLTLIPIKATASWQE